MSLESNLPVRAAIDLRQSLDATGDELAVLRQRDTCQRIARERGWTVVGEYKDNSISASSARKVRPTTTGSWLTTPRARSRP